MKNTFYGYARVSSKDQNLDRQMISLREFGVSQCNVYQDKVSGKNFDRPAYHRLLKKLKPGDTLVVKSIDRLGSVEANYKGKACGCCCN